ncbi:MAG: hypothetical protein IPN00_12630 [Hydrogenophilales bacterium]|nr:hypothetical protein [Hydrogenophilales bacterium]
MSKALRYYRRAAELAPDDTWTWFYLGDLNMAAGDLAAALSGYEQARQVIDQRAIQPDEADALGAEDRSGAGREGRPRDLRRQHRMAGPVGEGSATCWWPRATAGALAAYRLASPPGARAGQHHEATCR